MTKPTTEVKPPRVPLGQRPVADVDQTVHRVVGRQAKGEPLDVAAFQSFVQ